MCFLEQLLGMKFCKIDLAQFTAYPMFSKCYWYNDYQKGSFGSRENKVIWEYDLQEFNYEENKYFS